MQSTSTTYKNLLTNVNHTFGVRLNIGGTIYGTDAIFSAKASSRLFDTEPTIGGTYSNTFEFSVILPSGTNVARMATVVPQFRAESGGTTSTWYTYGTYFIDTREVSQNDSGLTVFKAFCYDAMLKANADYGTSSLSWPATDTTVVGEIASKIGVTVDSRTTALMTKGYTIPTVPIGYTLRDILSYLGVMYGGNWIITPANKLRLVPIAGGTDTLAVGKSATNLTVSPTRPAYTKLQVSVSEDTDAVIESGSSDDTVMTAVCPFITQAISDTVFTSLSAFQYKPFTANGVWSDPAVELGDIVTINGFTAPVCAIDTSFGSGMVMEMSAPNDNYIDHEYAYESPTSRSYKKTMGQMSTAIEQNEEAVRITAEKLSNIGGRNLALATGTGRSGTSSGGNLVLAKYDLSQYGQAEYLNNTTESMVISYDYEVTGGLSYGSASAELHTRIAGTIGKFGVLSLTEENRTGRRVVTSTLNTDQATSNNPDVSVRLRYAADGATITIKNLKVERGEIATDWSPAPEDLENYAVETARSQVEVSATNILAEVDQTLESYSTTTQMTAAINASAQNITSTVSETYETKADAAVVNLLPSVYYRENASGREFTVNGITWTANADGSVTAKGTATAPTTYALSGSNATDVVPWIPIEDGVSYHFSPGVDDGDWQTGYALQVQFFNASGTSLANRAFQTKAGSAVTFSGQAYAYARLTIASGYACPTDGITFYPMMERGTVGHAYVSTHNGSYAMQSQIVQNATSISSKVSKTDYNGNTIASLINQSASTVQIEAQHINLNGVVTANDNVQILTDGTIKAVNADISGKFTMTDGTINITTSAESSDIIKLTKNNGFVAMSTGGVLGTYTYGIAMAVGSNLGTVVVEPDIIRYIDANDKQRATIQQDAVYLIDSNGKLRGYLTENSVGVYDSTGNGGTFLSPTGLTFANASGTVTAQYPAAGFSAANLKNSVSGTIPGASSKTITFRGESVALILIQSGYGIGWGSYIYNGYGVSDVRQHVTALQAGTGITFTINSAAQSVTFNNTQAADRSVNVTVVMLFGANAPTIA